MAKQQKQQYFEQLKKIDKAKTMALPDVINILTNGAVTQKQVKWFLTSIEGNQFGQYASIWELVHRTDWKKMKFQQIYLVLKSIKTFLRNQKGLTGSMSDTLELKQQKDINLTKVLDSERSIIHILIDETHKEKQEITREAAAQSVVQKEEYAVKSQRHKQRLVKKLMIIFDFYRKNMHIEGQSFEKNKNLADYFDIKLFMKYAKEFDLLTLFPNHQITVAFKVHALNTIWIDFDRFIEVHWELINYKEPCSGKQDYMRLKQLNEVVSSEKLKKMLNVRAVNNRTRVIKNHTGAYQEDIVKKIEQKNLVRRQKMNSRYYKRKVRTEQSEEPKHIAHPNQRVQTYSIMKKINSDPHLKVKARIHTDQPQSIYDELKLPKLRVKQLRNESIYNSLNLLKLSEELQSIKKIVNVDQQQQYLNLYLRKEKNIRKMERKQFKDGKYIKPLELPPMRFT